MTMHFQRNAHRLHVPDNEFAVDLQQHQTAVFITRERHSITLPEAK